MMRPPSPIIYLSGIFLIIFLLITFIKSQEEGPVSESATRISGMKRTQIDQFWYLYGQASEHHRTGDFERAATAYRKALRLNDRHEDTLYYLGNTLIQLARYREAIDMFRKLSEINPLSTRAHFQIGTILSSTESDAPFDLDAAEQEFQRTLEINREESEPLLRLGEIAVAKGAFDRAEMHLSDTIRLNRKAVTAYYLLGYIKWLDGHSDEARRLFNEARIHNRKEQPVNDVAGEGDTRDGQPLGNARHSLFSQLVEDAMAPATEPSDTQIDAVYRQVRRFCDEVAGRWRKQQNDTSG
jgi:tetratricopeptide (TPR) repeat protein